MNEEFDQITSVMEFCHIIILAQLDSPTPWCITVKKVHILIFF